MTTTMNNNNNEDVTALCLSENCSSTTTTNTITRTTATPSTAPASSSSSYLNHHHDDEDKPQDDYDYGAGSSISSGCWCHDTMRMSQHGRRRLFTTKRIVLLVSVTVVGLIACWGTMASFSSSTTRHHHQPLLPSLSSSSQVMITSKKNEKGRDDDEIKININPHHHGHGKHRDDDDDDAKNINEIKHASCWSDSVFYLKREPINSTHQWYFDISALGHYVPSTHPEPRYDHLSCFVMKTRYNCAKPSQSSSNETSSNRTRSIANAISTDAVASDYKLVLWPQDHLHKDNNKSQSLNQPIKPTGDNSGMADDGDNTVCDLPAFIEDLGGPAGVASLILKQKRDSMSTSSNSNNNKSKKRLAVVFLGSSFLRQIWESLACSWKDQITDLTLYYRDTELSNINSSFPDASRIISFVKGNGKIENGAFIRGLLPITEGCHASSPRPEMKEWFHPEVTLLPPTIPGCTDDLAMVEFSHAIRFYYIMRPDLRCRNLTHVYDELNLEVSDIDAHVTNIGNFHKIYPVDLKQKLSPGVLDNATFFLEKTNYEELQKRDLKRWFGADNPGIFDPPDTHPCMPGVPDDEANVVLYELLLRLLK